MPKSHVIPAQDRLGLARVEAAEYIGVSPSLFDQMVEDGRMPQPKPINSRRVWSRTQIEKAFANLPEAGPDALNDNDWTDCA